MSRSKSNRPPSLRMTVIAQDPGFRQDGRILTTQVEVPAERVAPGPGGARVKVIDYDTSTGTLYRPFAECVGRDGEFVEVFHGRLSDDRLLADPRFHAQNVYAIVMSTLARFEKALGRRVSWGFGGHQIYVAPHAFCEANAFYSEDDRALLFGYFPDPGPGRRRPVFACLSHDVVVHEATHAILDGLRDRFTEPSSLAQDAFHEGFADIVALLAVLSSKDLVSALLAAARGGKMTSSARLQIPLAALSPGNLKSSALFTLAEQMGSAIAGVRGAPLRESLAIARDDSWKRDPSFGEPHRHGEILVAAVMHAYAEVWHRRIRRLAAGLGRTDPRDTINRDLAAEEGAVAAGTLLTILIRAIDYTAPTHITFEDFLSALLTADQQVVPDDGRYAYREALRTSFGAFGIEPASGKVADGTWERIPGQLRYDRVRFESILRDPEEMFRFIWDNRIVLGLTDAAYTRVESVRPVARVTPDGFFVHETVAEYTQRISVPVNRLGRLGIRRPRDLPDDQVVALWGGGTLVFDEYANVKFHVRNRVLNRTRQEARLQYQAESGHFAEDTALAATFARRHLARRLGSRAFRRQATF